MQVTTSSYYKKQSNNLGFSEEPIKIQVGSQDFALNDKIKQTIERVDCRAKDKRYYLALNMGYDLFLYVL